MWVRVLRGLYFPEGDFLTAKEGKKKKEVELPRVRIVSW